MPAEHRSIEPAILYFGAPVILVSTQNQDDTANLAPISSAWWLGWRCMLGLSAASKTTENLIRTGECVLNLPSVNQVGAVDRLARLTGSDPAPESKLAKGYRHEAKKFEAAGLTPVPSCTVAPPRALECPIHMEAVFAAKHGLGEDSPWKGALLAFELRVQRVHVAPQILMDGFENRIDPDKWRPLIMSFQNFYGLAEGRVQSSRLAEISEDSYRSPDVDRARRAPGNQTDAALETFDHTVTAPPPGS
ncbi:flavin reductase family protein [Methylocystis heyeri]|uniref:Flavin reductase family protein n=1 Tax=Methylocystis heyeri TaxID=391905 RepID=A0A6B8KAU9_9HYPH|nr:flavin reductase family protein [Methylocystis heyeri]QGM45226.1 flavin reductase family protein [Methylocystis heyeri]